jgi:hypothetical protein
MSRFFGFCRELAFSEPVVEQFRPLVAALAFGRNSKTVPSRAEHVELRRAAKQGTCSCRHPHPVVLVNDIIELSCSG